MRKGTVRPRVKKAANIWLPTQYLAGRLARDVGLRNSYLPRKDQDDVQLEDSRFLRAPFATLCGTL